MSTDYWQSTELEELCACAVEVPLNLAFRGRLYKKVIKINYNQVEAPSNKKRVFES